MTHRQHGDAPERGQGPVPMRTLQVSRTTARFISDGHPWVRRDRHTIGLADLTAGQSVTLVDQGGRRLASALADPAHDLCARVYHRRPDMAFIPAQALQRAWARRSALADDPQTDCYRLVHGEADFLPGVRIERYASVWVILLLAECSLAHVDAVAQALRDLAPDAVIVVRDHIEDLRHAPVATRRLDGNAVDPDGVVNARELGVSYPLMPFGGLATGLYVDQRSTRQWLRGFAPGARVLNLFAYTGAFSLALLSAGAANALDVDLSAPALARAQEAARLNAVADRHRIIHDDCRAMLRRSDEMFDLIICDPPTAAMGAGGWVLRRDYPQVLQLACQRLAPGGMLIACCNTIGGKPYDIMAAVVQAAQGAGIRFTQVDGPPLGPDLPQLERFPEGRPFRLVCIRRAATP